MFTRYAITLRSLTFNKIILNGLNTCQYSVQTIIYNEFDKNLRKKMDVHMVSPVNKASPKDLNTKFMC